MPTGVMQHINTIYSIDPIARERERESPRSLYLGRRVSRSVLNMYIYIHIYIRHRALARERVLSFTQNNTEHSLRIVLLFRDLRIEQNSSKEPRPISPRGLHKPPPPPFDPEKRPKKQMLPKSLFAPLRLPKGLRNAPESNPRGGPRRLFFTLSSFSAKM